MNKPDCSDLGTGGRAVCDDEYYCEKHYQETYKDRCLAAIVAAVDQVVYEQDLRDAGRGHLLPPDDQPEKVRAFTGESCAPAPGVKTIDAAEVYDTRKLHE